MYQKNPLKIELSSMDMIEQNLKSHHYSPEELAVVKRMIHTSGDFDYQDIVSIQQGAIKTAIKALREGCRIVTDTKMALAGINKLAIDKLSCKLENYVDHETVVSTARKMETTRSMAAIDFAVEKGRVDIFVIGNAPTALYRIGELIQENKIRPDLVIGVPVGFVGAAESKEFIRSMEIPAVTTIGNKGGSNIAAAVMNAILYLKAGRDG